MQPQGTLQSFPTNPESMVVQRMFRQSTNAGIVQRNLVKLIPQHYKPILLLKNCKEYQNLLLITAPFKSKLQSASTQCESVSPSTLKYHSKNQIKDPSHTRNATLKTDVDKYDDSFQERTVSDAVVVIEKNTCERKRIFSKISVKNNNPMHQVDSKAKRDSPNPQEKIRPPRSQVYKNIKLQLPQIKDEKKKALPMLIRNWQELKKIKSESYAIVQYPSERLVVSHCGNSCLQIASLTKIMTFYVIIKQAEKKGINLSDQYLVISDHVVRVAGTSADIQEGERYTIEQLLYGLMLPSGNDAAIQLAVWAGKFMTEDRERKSRLKAFIAQMNQCAKQLGLLNSRFANPHGLPHQQAKSTAIEVAKLCLVCMRCDLFRKIVSTQVYAITVPNQLTQKNRLVQWENTNKLLRRPGFIGLKTGITVTAGPCLASAFQFRNHIYISVLLRAPKISGRFKQTRKLLFWALNKLYGPMATQEQQRMIKSLKKNNLQLDSDYSEEEQQFKYNRSSYAQYKKRCNIIDYEL